MSNKKRNDFSYYLWGEITIIDNNKFTMEMNHKYGKGSIKGHLFDTGINVAITDVKNINCKIEKPIEQYKKNVFYFGKNLKGRHFITLENNKSILVNEGDIFCFIGNYHISPQYVFQEEFIFIGILSYADELEAALKKKSLYTSKIKEIFSDNNFKNGITFIKTDEIENIIEELHLAINNDDSFDLYIKSLNMFNYLVYNYNKKIYKKYKTYKDNQVETVIKIKEFLDEHLDTYYSMPTLCEIFNISLSRMQSIFFDYYNMSPYRYHLNARLEKAYNLIVTTDQKITTIAKSLGFTSYNKFSIAYKNKYNCNPSNHRNP